MLEVSLSCPGSLLDYYRFKESNTKIKVHSVILITKTMSDTSTAYCTIPITLIKWQSNCKFVINLIKFIIYVVYDNCINAIKIN